MRRKNVAKRSQRISSEENKSKAKRDAGKLVASRDGMLERRNLKSGNDRISQEKEDNVNTKMEREDEK